MHKPDKNSETGTAAADIVLPFANALAFDVRLFGLMTTAAKETP